ncbi:MAG: hypothetical protein ACFE9Z_07705 [Promethearchaeota archaeon]
MAEDILLIFTFIGIILLSIIMMLISLKEAFNEEGNTNLMVIFCLGFIMIISFTLLIGLFGS